MGDLYLQKNAGVVDRIVRVVLGVALILVSAGLGWAPWVIAVTAAIGGSQVVEGLTGY